MARRSDRVGARRIKVPLGQDGITFERREGTTQRLRAKDHLRMIDAGAAFGCRQIISAVLAQDVRAFDPDRLLADIDAAVDELGAGPHHLAGAPVIFLDPDGPMPIVARRLVGRAIVDDIGLVPFPVDRRVDAFEGEPDGVRPRAGRVLGGDDEIASAFDAGIGDVEKAVMPADVGREHALRRAAAGEIELFGPVDGIGDLSPVDKVFRREDRNTGEMSEGAVDEIIVVADPRDRRVGIIAAQDRIAKFAWTQGAVRCILATVAKFVKSRGRSCQRGGGAQERHREHRLPANAPHIRLLAGAGVHALLPFAAMIALSTRPVERQPCRAKPAGLRQSPRGPPPTYPKT